jgi:hypothetical protein
VAKDPGRIVEMNEEETGSNKCAIPWIAIIRAKKVTYQSMTVAPPFQNMPADFKRRFRYQAVFIVIQSITSFDRHRKK